MSSGRPSRGARVVYKEVDSDEDEFESEESFEDFVAEEKIFQAVFPPLTPLQLELRQLCRSGDKSMLKTFLANNPDIDLDVKDPEAGTTALNEVATKSAQFSEIVEMLINAGAGLEITDGLGNTPLHNAVLYYPSTQETVDLLLEKGANVSAMNYEGSTPLLMADDKDLKTVLKQLKKVGEKKNNAGGGSGYTGSPDLRKLVFDKKLTEERNNLNIIVRYNSPVTVKSPGLLKRKRDNDDHDESFGKKRIRFSEQDSTGADIDPQFSDDDSDMDSNLDKKEENYIKEPQEGECKIEDGEVVDSKDSDDDDKVSCIGNEITISDPKCGLLSSSSLMNALPSDIQSLPVKSEVEAAPTSLSELVPTTTVTQSKKQSSITSFFLPRDDSDASQKMNTPSTNEISHDREVSVSVTPKPEESNFQKESTVGFGKYSCIGVNSVSNSESTTKEKLTEVCSLDLDDS